MPAHKGVRFRTTVVAGHKGKAVEVPFDPGERWELPLQPIRPGRRGYAVAASVEGSRFAGHVVARSKKFWLPLPPLVALATNVRPGDEIDVMLEPVWAIRQPSQQA